MKTMKWLLRREFWENKGSMFWAPIVVGALMVLFVGFTVLYGTASGEFNNKVVVTHEDGKAPVTTVTKNDVGLQFQALPEKEKQQIASMVSSGYMAASAPLFLMLSVVAFFYCLSALNEERRDRSILFWKSLPVSDAHTVLSKVVTASLVAPLITIAVGTFVSLLLLLIVGTTAAFHGVNLFGAVLSNADFYLAPLQLLGMLPVYVLWALPTIGWLLMVSAWAKSKVFLWAVGTPLLVVVIVKWTNFMLHFGIKIDWLIENVIARTLFGLVPGTWLAVNKVDTQTMVNEQHTAIIGEVFKQSWMSLSSPNAWIGAIAGVAMIVVAIRLRRWKDEA
ncbi:MAG: hypothetical protein V4484_10630 [Pseudomonadota bacterium]